MNLPRFSAPPSGQREPERRGPTEELVAKRDGEACSSRLRDAMNLGDEIESID